MLRGQDVTVTSPCPVDLDETGLRGKGDAWHCGHCSKTVHVLSEMTESEARSLLAKSEGQKICVSYRMSPQGEIRFKSDAAPPVVPISALRRRPAAIAAVAMGVALAACAPHDNPRVEGQHPAMMHRVQPLQQTKVEPLGPDIVADGGLVVPRDVQVDGDVGFVKAPPVVEPPRDTMIEGGIGPRIVAPATDEPCEKPKPTTAPMEMNVRGGRG